MKKIVLLVLSIIVSLTIFSCTVNNNENGTITRSPKWSLVRVTGGIAGSETNLELGQITWVFDELNNTIIVEENEEGVAYALSE